MSYNGIGLSTARGSGTNGYVQRNMSALRPNRERQPLRNSHDQHLAKQPKPMLANQDIIEHNQRRAVQVEVMKVRIKLEDEGHPEEYIEKRLEELRNTLKNGSVPEQFSSRELESHEVARRTLEKNEKMRSALGLKDDFVVGQAFDQEKMEKEKAQRLENRPKGVVPTSWLDRGDGPLPERNTRRGSSRYRNRGRGGYSGRDRSRDRGRGSNRDKNRDQPQSRHSHVEADDFQKRSRREDYDSSDHEPAGSSHRRRHRRSRSRSSSGSYGRDNRRYTKSLSRELPEDRHVRSRSRHRSSRPRQDRVNSPKAVRDIAASHEVGSSANVGDRPDQSPLSQSSHASGSESESVSDSSDSGESEERRRRDRRRRHRCGSESDSPSPKRRAPVHSRRHQSRSE